MPEQLSVPLVTRATNLEDAGVEQERKSAPPPVFSAPPQQELEQELNRNPHDLDKKADVGSDESMDASDPPAAAQPGLGDDPVPSSGFPE
ncbi:MAG TPA: hypothetical protein VM265_08790 [Sphingomicrobium sp.]|nr:hypothetical protein [Sphingomicrobium sp.]